MTGSLRDAHPLAWLAPALPVAVTALFALPEEAGGFRLAKWGAFGLMLALGAAVLVFLRPTRLPRGSAVVGGFTTSAVLLPVFSSELLPSHWPTALGMLSGLALFFVSACALTRDAPHPEGSARRSSLIVVVLSGTVCALVVLLQAAGLRWLTSDVYTGPEFRAPGTFGNPNWAAGFLAPLVPLALGLALGARRRWAYYGAAALLASATMATLSKGGVLALVVGLCAFALLDHRVPQRRRLALAGAFLACVAFALAFGLQSGLTTQAPWLRGRLFLWRAALWLVGQHPFTGVGLGAYPSAYGQAAAKLIEADPTTFFPLSTVDFVHNDLLQLAAEGGVVTAASFVLVVGIALTNASRLWDPLASAAGAALAAICANGLAESALKIPSTFVLFFFLLGWLSSCVPAISARANHAHLLRSLFFGFTLLGVVQGVRFFAGNAAWTRGRDALLAGEFATSELERARFWLPEHGRSASLLTRALARAGRIDEALATAALAASLRFDLDDEFFRRDLQSRSTDRKASIQSWQEFSERFPMLVTPQLRLGALYLQENDRAAAVVAFETVLANPQPTERAEKARSQARGMLRLLNGSSALAPK